MVEALPVPSFPRSDFSLMRIPALADYSRKNIFETVKDIRDATIMVRQLREQKQSACQFPTEHFVETY